MEHHFNIEIATEYGVEEAIFLHNIFFWIAKNAANEKHFHDGLYWFYNSKKAFVELFPYMNEPKITRVIKNLEDAELIVKGNFSEDKWNKTNWYALTKQGLEYMCEKGYKFDSLYRCVQNACIDDSKMNNRMMQNEQCIYNTNNNTNNTDSNTDTNKEEDTNVSPKKNNDYKTIVDCWNEYNGQRLGRVTKLTERRKHAIKKVIDDNEITQEQLMQLFKALPLADSWLYNPNKQHKNWKPDFDWWMANTNGWLTKALEGKVHKENPQAYASIIQGDDAPYSPLTDGEIQWNDYYKSYIYVGMDLRWIPDGYTDDNRPDGATIMLNNGRGTIVWDKSTKSWNKK